MRALIKLDNTAIYCILSVIDAFQFGEKIDTDPREFELAL